MLVFQQKHKEEKLQKEMAKVLEHAAETENLERSLQVVHGELLTTREEQLELRKSLGHAQTENAELRRSLNYVA